MVLAHSMAVAMAVHMDNLVQDTVLEHYNLQQLELALVQHWIIHTP
jgi:hypothetical protein